MRRPRLLPLLGAICIALPILEIVGIIWVGHEIGAGWTFLLLVAGVLAGASLIQRAGQRSVMSTLTDMRRGRPSTDHLVRSAWMGLGGLLLMVPGFITDVLAVLVMVPTTRRLLGRALRPLGFKTTTWAPPAASRDDAEPTVVRGDVL